MCTTIRRFDSVELYLYRPGSIFPIRFVIVHKMEYMNTENRTEHIARAYACVCVCVRDPLNHSNDT